MGAGAGAARVGDVAVAVTVALDPGAAATVGKSVAVGWVDVAVGRMNWAIGSGVSNATEFLTIRKYHAATPINPQKITAIPAPSKAGTSQDRLFFGADIHSLSKGIIAYKVCKSSEAFVL